MRFAVINAKLYDFSSYIDDGYVIFDDQIIEAGHMKNFKDDNYKIIDAKGAFVLPGLVACHTHIYSVFARGFGMPFNPHNFQEILDQLWWKLDHYIDNDITYYSGISYASECLKNGITTIIDHHASGSEIIGSLKSLKKAVCDVAKMRALFCFETSDRYPIKDCIKENVNFYNKYHSDVCGGLFGMHAQMSLSEKSLKLISKASSDMPLHIHVAESEMDEEDCLNKYGERIIERLNRHHLLRKNSLFVHGVHLNEEEVKLLKDHEIYMVVNTTSNMNNAVGLPNVKSYLDNGIKVMVGNDGLSSNITNEYVNVLFTSHLKNQSPVELNLNDVLKMINNSYEYISNQLNIKLGRIEKGYKADLLIVPYTPFTKMDSDNVFGHIFYGLFNAFKPKDVFARGIRMVKNYEIVNNKLTKELGRAQEAADKLHTLVREGE